MKKYEKRGISLPTFQEADRACTFHLPISLFHDLALFRNLTGEAMRDVMAEALRRYIASEAPKLPQVALFRSLQPSGPTEPPDDASEWL